MLMRDGIECIAILTLVGWKGEMLSKIIDVVSLKSWLFSYRLPVSPLYYVSTLVKYTHYMVIVLFAIMVQIRMRQC